MHNPINPGRIIREEYLEPFEDSTETLSKALSCNRGVMEFLLNEKSNISPEIAAKLARVFNTNAEVWMSMQRNYDLKKSI